MNNLKMQYKNNSNITTNIGIALTFVGVSLGMYFNFFLPVVVEWSPVFMTLSVLLIMSYKNLFIGRFPSFNTTFLLILLFQFLMLFYGSLSDRMNAQYLSFHLYIITLIIALSTNNNKLNYDNVILVFFIISSICTSLGACFLWIMGKEVLLSKQESEILEPFTMANGVIVNFISALFLFENKKKWLKILLVCFVVIDVCVLFILTKRTPIAVLIMVLILFLYKKSYLNVKMLFRYITIFFSIIFLAIILYCNVEIVTETLDSFWYNFSNGIHNIMGNNKVSDATESASERYKLRLYAYNYINTHFTSFNYVFGGGYMVQWLDNSILQSYLDMGILGIVCYTSIVIIFPVKIFIKRNISILAFFCTLMCMHNVFSAIHSGNPYMSVKFIPVVILTFVLTLEKKRILYQ